MDIVENLMQTRRWAKTCLRHNIVRPEEVEMWKKTKIAHVQSNSPSKSKHDQALKSAIEAIAPEWWGGRHPRMPKQGRPMSEAQGREQGAFVHFVVGGLHRRGTVAR